MSLKFGGYTRFLYLCCDFDIGMKGILFFFKDE